MQLLSTQWFSMMKGPFITKVANKLLGDAKGQLSSASNFLRLTTRHPNGRTKEELSPIAVRLQTAFRNNMEVEQIHHMDPSCRGTSLSKGQSVDREILLLLCFFLALAVSGTAKMHEARRMSAHHFPWTLFCILFTSWLPWLKQIQEVAEPRKTY